MYDKSILNQELLAELEIKREQMRREGFRAAVPAIGEDGAEALGYLYGIYEGKMYLWLADLWEPEIGAFYYSNSGRDTEGFLPDIESTMQAISFINTSGLSQAVGGDVRATPPAYMREPIAKFAMGLQDPDGYFYHPQWGKNIGTSRRGRDLNWSLDAVETFGGTLRYPSPLEKNADSAPSSLLPEHLRTVEAFKVYLSALDLANSSYSVGNLIQSQVPQIKAAGQEYVDTLISWYNANQNSENGTWESEVKYASTNGLMKVALAYSAIGAKFPNAEKAMEAAIEVTLSPKPSGQITSMYNPWVTMKILINNLASYGEEKIANAMTARMQENAARMIISTADKIKVFRKPDGSFSYSPNNSAARSQGAPVATPGTNEGDINGNALASTGAVRNICQSLDVPLVRLFCKEDGELFFKLLESSYPSKKIYPPAVFN